ncbi:hypothetical protein GOP47_0011787 [Adiantum capillus-veneris]|uniref:Uncharacterized protein n=1 Tax=Adiantum capillus-veneris TaxID=13818 RepID=A0A9D4UTF0_ADICA|nr:hypothetical protein GOP47_0011787 [Adiantum capillus-veneris]
MSILLRLDRELGLRLLRVAHDIARVGASDEVRGPQHSTTQASQVVERDVEVEVQEDVGVSNKEAGFASQFIHLHYRPRR